MERRALGNTGLWVSEVGLGTWQLGNADLPDAEAHAIVGAALEAGCDFFDTAPGYGQGRSEELLGAALAGVRHRVTLCTKFVTYDDAGQRSFDVERLRPTLEGSLRRLRTDYIDVLLLHNPPFELMDGTRAPHYELLERLKGEGKLRAYGVSLDSRRELECVVETTHSGAAEVMLNAFHQEPAAAFAAAQARGVGLIVKVPLDSGWLSGRYAADSRFEDIRRRWSPQVIARRARCLDALSELIPPDVSLPHAALQFVLAHPQVSTVIPGAKTVAQLQDNIAACRGRLDPSVLQAMRELWRRELSGEPLPW